MMRYARQAIVMTFILGVCVADVSAEAKKKRSRGKRKGKRAFVLPPGVTVEKDIIYGKAGDTELKLDLYLPKPGGPARPGIVFIHGGGWRGGSKGQFRQQAAHLAGKGYVGACIVYRYSKQATFPAALEDCKCAVRWMRCVAKKYNIDPKRIAAVGGSAGGHLAGMVAYTDPSHGWEGKGGHDTQSSAVQAVAMFNPVLDLVHCAKKKMLGNSMKLFVGKTYQEAPELYEAASPMTHLDATCPPTLTLHGTADKTVPYEQSVKLVERLKKLGVPAELYTAEGQPHAFFNPPKPHFKPTLARLEAFLDKHLKK